MRPIIASVVAYVRSVSIVSFLLATTFIGLFIFCNYYFGINDHIDTLPAFYQFASWYSIFLLAFCTGYLVQFQQRFFQLFQKPILLFLLLAAPAFFAWKMMARFDFDLVDDPFENYYWNLLLYWPLKAVIISTALFLIWKRLQPQLPFYGTAGKNFNVAPYFILLLLMLPLLGWAAQQPDFLRVYPKFHKSIFLAGHTQWYYKLLYELSYGTDFFTIELFFRGFLVLAFSQYVGKAAVLPMALFYCTIHFGKPLGECISSYFGGLILGSVILKSETIWGGLVVHLGIAWLMELFGYFGQQHLF